MLTIGLTGMSGSGKSTIAKLFAQYNVFYINADEVYHSMIAQSSPCLDALVCEFGIHILTDGGALDRAVLRDIVFSDNAKLEKLNDISHRYVLDEIRAMIKSIESEGCRAVLVDAPQLFESGFDSECDVIISVIASEDLRLKRIVERDGITEDVAKRRLRNQHTDEFFKSKSDFVIENNGSIEALNDDVKRIINNII